MTKIVHTDKKEVIGKTNVIIVKTNGIVFSRKETKEISKILKKKR
jgi:filamentous hemagglutinin family protein